MVAESDPRNRLRTGLPCGAPSHRSLRGRSESIATPDAEQALVGLQSLPGGLAVGVLDELPDAVTVQSPEGLVYANRQALETLGFASVEDLARAPLDHFTARYSTFDVQGRPFPLDDLPGRRVLRGEPGAEELLRNVDAETGDESWHIVQATPFETAAGRLAIIVVRDVTELKRAEEGLRLLVDVSSALASSLDYREAVAELAPILVPFAVDGLLVERVAPGERELLLVHAADPEEERRLRELHVAGRLPSEDDLGPGDQLLHLPALAVGDGLPPRALVLVPLHIRGEILGTLTLVLGASRRRFGEAELTLADLVGRRVAVAVDNSLLYARQLEVTEEARSAQQRLRFAAEASAALAGSLEYEETVARLLHLAVPELADWCIIDVLERDGRIQRVAAAAADPVKQEILDELRGSYPPSLDSPQPAARAMRSGERSLIERFDPSRLRETVLDERHYALLEGLAPRSAVAVPLVARGETIGALTLAWAESERAYDEESIARIEELASRAALAVANARLYRDAEHAQARLALLAGASDELASSLEFEVTFQNVAELAVPAFADWCIVDVLEESGELVRVAVQHEDPEQVAAAHELWVRYPTAEDEGAQRVIRTGQGERFEIEDEHLRGLARDAEHLERLRLLGFRSYLCVPMIARGVVLGALTFATAESGRRYGEDDLALAEELARRAATAVDNARLFQQAEERGEAARALAYVGDGVFLVDRQGILRLWNPAAEAITGLPAREVIHRPVAQAIPGWDSIVLRIPVGSAPARARRPETLPVEVDGRELWLSIAGVSYPGGTVYAFRDLTEEHRIERLKSDFVSTISHELRTPLAAIYGAALTLRRGDIVLEPDQREGLLTVIASESDRLARIVHDVLYASRIETGSMRVVIESTDALALTTSIVDAARTHKPSGIEIRLRTPKALPRVAADPDKVSQVLSNLLENAVKYSPDGGEVEVRLEPVGRSVRFSVRDQGIGIPQQEQERIFEKFYRLDPDLTRGVGGTGLGLYICREIIRRMGGRIWVHSRPGKGSTFFFDLPLV